MQQSIAGFEKNFGVDQEIDQQVANMTYYDKKQLTVASFGTGKAKRKLASLQANRVEENVADGSPNKRSKKGTGDDRLQGMAEKIVEEAEQVKKDAITTIAQRKELYSLDNLIPPQLLSQIPYKSTMAAMVAEDTEELRQLLCSFVVVLAQKTG